MKKVLIALDNSDSALRAVDYAAGQFSGNPDMEIGLVHVLPNLPAIFWDEGHILSDNEKTERKRVVDKWIADRKATMEPVFKKASGMLIGSGINSDRITAKSISDSTDVSKSLLEEARDGGYQTVIVGRCNKSAKHLLGSVSGRIVSQGSGLAITVIG